MQDLMIPEKSVFKMNEVCELTGVKPYVLRFWESEFVEIEPLSSTNGQKLYERTDIKVVAYIRKLLFEDKLTIEHAKLKVSKFVENNYSYESQKVAQDIQNITIQDTVEEQKDVQIEDDFLMKEIDELRNELSGILSKTRSIQKTHNWL